MNRDELYRICCPACGAMVCKSSSGAKFIVRCSKCRSELYYEVGDKGAAVKLYWPGYSGKPEPLIKN